MFSTGIKVTERTREALVLASQEALRAQNTAIGPEHLLLAVLRQEASGAADVLAALGADRLQIQAAVADWLTRQPPPHGSGLTSAANNAVQFAVAEAQRRGHDFAGTEHLLLGLATGQNALAELLEDIGLGAASIQSTAEGLWRHEPLPLDQRDRQQ